MPFPEQLTARFAEWVHVDEHAFNADKSSFESVVRVSEPGHPHQRGDLATPGGEPFDAALFQTASSGVTRGMSVQIKLQRDLNSSDRLTTTIKAQRVGDKLMQTAEGVQSSMMRRVKANRRCAE